MGFILKALSILSGSSEETLLNARKEVQMLTNSKDISDELEKKFIIEKLGHDLANLLRDRNKPAQVTREFLLNTSNMAIILGHIINTYVNEREEKKLQILNRVLFRYYGYTPGQEDKLEPALRKLSIDIIEYSKSIGVI